MKNVCKKFGVFANIIEDKVPLTTPFNWKCVSEHLEDMFPGLGNRIHAKSDSTVSVQRPMSIQPLANRYEALKATFEPGEIPEKRFKCYTSVPNHDTETVSACKEDLGKCMQNITGIVNNVFDLNVKLEEKMRDLEEKHEIEIKAAQKKHAYLSAQLSRQSSEMEDKIELMKREHYLEIIELKEEHNQSLLKVADETKEKWQSKLKNQQTLLNETENEISLLKTRHEKDIARYEKNRKQIITESYELIARKNEEKDQAVAEAREKCWRECSAMIEDAKVKKYCVGCGAGKPLDLFYVCNAECQRRYR